MKNLVALLNEALKMEHAAAIQYYSHAEIIIGPFVEPVIARLRELAGDENKHAATLRTILADFLFSDPPMDLAPTKKASGIPDIISTNIGSEREAVDIYRRILIELEAVKAQLPDAYEYICFEIDAILREEQAHISELKRLEEI